MVPENNVVLQSTEDDAIKRMVRDVKEVSRFIFSKKYILLILGVIGGVIGFFYAKSKKPIYTATTTFVIEGDNAPSLLSQYSGLASMIGMDLGSQGEGLFQGENLLELYRSRNMVEKTLMTPIEINKQKQLLVDRYVEFNELKNDWANAKNAQELLAVNFAIPTEKMGEKVLRTRDSLLGVFTKDLLKNNLNVNKLDKKMSIVKIDVSTTDEFFSKKFNEELVNNVNEFYIKTKTKKSLNNVNILQSKVDSVRSVMNGSISSAAAAIDATPNLNPTRQALRQVPTQRSQFTAETNKAILGELVKNLELTKMALLKETPLIQQVDQPILPLEVKKKGKLVHAFLGGCIAFFLGLGFYFFSYLFKKVLV